MNARRLLSTLLALVCTLAAAAAAAPLPTVRLLRVPRHGTQSSIQPQAVVDSTGAIDLVYFSGPAAHGNLFFIRSTDGGRHWSAPLPVNHQPGDAIAIGNMRGAHLALGWHGQVFVAWEGSDKAQPRGPHGGAPMLFTRMNPARTAFLPERNLVTHAWTLDGGAVAADMRGNVYVFWHAPGLGGRDEAHRRVWMTRSRDGGRHFSPERPISPAALGACGCCGMSASTDSAGRLYVLYRSARARVHRDEFLLESSDHGLDFTARDVGPWKVGYCVLSTAALVPSGSDMLAAWEQRRQVAGEVLAHGHAIAHLLPPGNPGNRAHPVIARDALGDILLAWTEGMGWQRGGSLAWRLFDRSGRPLPAHGIAPGVPTWSLVAAVWVPHRGFLVIY